MPVDHKICLNVDGEVGVVSLNPIKAIRKKCLDCSNFSSNDVKDCPVEMCPLHPFRLGKDPSRKKKELSPEQMAALVEHMKRIRKS